MTDPSDDARRAQHFEPSEIQPETPTGAGWICTRCGRGSEDVYDECVWCLHPGPVRDLRWPFRAMLIAAALTVGLATCALADQPDPCADVAAMPDAVTFTLSSSPYADTATMAPDPVHVARLCYHNHAMRGSAPGPFVVTGAGVSVEITVEIGSSAPETITVVPPEGLVVLPSDVLSVEDGGAVMFFIAEVKV